MWGNVIGGAAVSSQSGESCANCRRKWQSSLIKIWGSFMHFTCPINNQFSHSNHLEVRLEIPQIVDSFELSQSYASFQFYYFISFCFNSKQSSEDTCIIDKQINHHFAAIWQIEVHFPGC